MGIDPYPESVILGQMWDVGESEGDCDEGRGEASGTQFSASQLAARRALFSECQVCLLPPLVPLRLSRLFPLPSPIFFLNTTSFPVRSLFLSLSLLPVLPFPSLWHTELWLGDCVV